MRAIIFGLIGAVSLLGCNAEPNGSTVGVSAATSGLSAECKTLLGRVDKPPCESPERCKAFQKDGDRQREVVVYLERPRTYTSDKPDPEIDAEQERFRERVACMEELLVSLEYTLEDDDGLVRSITVTADSSTLDALIHAEGVDSVALYCGPDCDCGIRTPKTCEQDPFCVVDQVPVRHGADATCLTDTSLCVPGDCSLQNVPLSGVPDSVYREDPNGACLLLPEWCYEYPKAELDGACGDLDLELETCGRP